MKSNTKQETLITIPTENPADSYINISMLLGFNETDEMKKIRNDIVNRMKNKEPYKDLYIKYDNEAEKIGKKHTDQIGGMRLQVAVLMIKLSMYITGGKNDIANEAERDLEIYLAHLSNIDTSIRIM